MEEKREITCVYCGKVYPNETPTHGAIVLTNHIKICEKHPMRNAEKTIAKLRKALSELVGASKKEELEKLESAIRLMPGIEQDKIHVINAIHVLIETLPED